MRTIIDTTKAPVPQVVEFLKQRVDELPAKDRPFAYSLLGAAAGRGLSAKQTEWVRKMAARIIEPPVESKPVDLGDVSGLHVLFDRAHASGLQWPKLRTMTADGTELTLRRAGEKSKHLGQIMVTERVRRQAEVEDGERAVYYGRLDLAGVFHPGAKAKPEQLEQAQQALMAIAVDPAGAGQAYGQITGCCAFCALPLEDGRSIEVGYGPVCAEKWGLPWGAKVVKAKARRKGGRS